ncbi:MAG: response regulator, partial [Bacteroidales bacterium]|nr:response regulator [Bacteroidales bacterium]
LRTFTQADGLLTDQFNYSSGIRLGDRTFCFGSIRGMICFEPEKISSNKTVPPVVITSFLLSDSGSGSTKNGDILVTTPYSPDITLKHNQSSFTVSFSALSFVSPRQNRYSYILDGFDESWKENIGVNHVNYIKVPPGKYIFRVKGANSDGIWNEKEAVISIIIRPPFLRSLLGRILLWILSIGALAAGIIALQIRNNKRQEALMKNMRDEDERASQKSKLEFISNLMHEIRTPLSLIKAPYELLVSPSCSEEDRTESLNVMGNNINRLLNISNELLDFSKLDAKGYRMHPEIMDVNAAVESSVEAFGADARRKGKRIDVNLPEKHILANLDGEAFDKIVSNLVGNAVKYSEKYISVTLKKDSDKQRFLLRIENDGPVISPENRENVFKAFFREKSSVNSLGTGLGLSIVKDFTKMLGGEIFIDETVTDANSFVVTLPEYLGDDSPGVVDNETADNVLAYETAPKKDTVLIVEDQAEMRQFLHKAFSKKFRTLSCCDGIQALGLLESKDVSVIITDLMMPGMDGYELCDKVKNNVQHSHIPIIILSAKSDYESKIRSIHEGADIYLEKPFSLEFLLATTEKLLERIENLRNSFLHNPVVPVQSIGGSDMDKAFLGKVSSLINQKDFQEELSIDKIAESMNLSRSSLYRKIKNLSGISPNEFIRVCRLKHAAELLKNKDLRVSEVAYISGFNSPSYFIKCFQKSFGMTPKEYINSYKVN